MESCRDFEKRKQAVMAAAEEQGIVDVVNGGNAKEGVSLETVELAAELMKEHGEAAYRRLEARLKAQA